MQEGVLRVYICVVSKYHRYNPGERDVRKKESFRNRFTHRFQSSSQDAHALFMWGLEGLSSERSPVREILARHQKRVFSQGTPCTARNMTTLDVKLEN